MFSANKNLGLLIALCLIVFFTNLGGPKLWDRDEPRNAGCAMEMIEAADWVVPRFNDELRTHKPVLLYWLMIASYSVFGISEFSARFFSAFLGMLTVLLTYDMGRRLFNSTAGLWAGVCLATTLMFTVASRAATPDAPLIFFVTLGLWIYVLFSFSADEESANANPGYYPTQWWQVALLYGALGLAVLSKGPVGLILPTAIIGMFLLIMRLPPAQPATTWRQWGVSLLRPFFPIHFLKTVWFMRPILAIVACLGVALPWYLWVAARDFRWIEGFFFDHNLNRAVTSFEGHSGPPVYYLVAICVGFFPWSVFFAPMLWDLSQQLRTGTKSKAALIFCCCWVAVWMGAFSIAQTKLPSYITPLYPALALITGVFVSRVTEKRTQLSARWLDLGFGLTTVVGVVLVVALAILAAKFMPGEELVALVGLLLVVGGGLAWWRKSQQNYQQAFRVFAVTSMLFVVGLFSVIAQRVSDQQEISRLLAEIQAAEPGARLCSFGVSEASWVFYARQPVKFIPEDQGDLQAEFAEAPNTVVLTTPEKLAELPPELRGQLTEVAQAPYFLKDYPLIALRPTPPFAELAAKKQAPSQR
ncbi:Undecaprenyl phosphate-alpha-4-amino-4-deoxy-L-arabinose arabinosyl transferase [Bremerella volcania]|uniref:Undecaprenyl phosphate-alpha-4-amino-4-deoxy-L-arabinose arabinosyl transferase n=1 Tax=Bremerella volcania TaxID=2527984 RepID=A0A518CAE4_9BACT|nr:glycosyltransferase family 39 protein [Bremerella volcania]QDU76164.1 Undecaprenyl phosphate-alpha-4-amino-4-deoxy-L-arabinose arabinosyl transferase [Bremerella volcania]